MKICIISNLYKPYVLGGAEIYVSKIIDYLTLNTKHQCVLITTKPYRDLLSLIPQEEIINDKLKIYRFYPLNLYHSYNAKKMPMLIHPLWHMFDLWNIHSYFSVKKILKKEKPDIVHTHNITGFSTSIFSVIKRVGVFHIHTIHDYQLLSPWAMLFKNNKVIDRFNIFDKIFYKIKRYFSKSIKVVLSPSQFAIDLHKRYNFFKNSKLICLPLGIETKKLPLIKKKNNFINIVYFGQLVLHKGILFAVKTFLEINNQNIRFHIAGDGPLFNQIEKTTETDRRIKLYRFISGINKIDLLSRADILIIPSIWYENSPVTIYEGFRHKITIIASKIGGVSELIRHNQNGVLFEPNNKSNLKEKLLKLINDNRLRKKLAENGRQDFINFYTIDKHFSKLEKIYHDAIS